MDFPSHLTSCNSCVVRRVHLAAIHIVSSKLVLPTGFEDRKCKFPVQPSSYYYQYKFPYLHLDLTIGFEKQLLGGKPT